jgi:hypothetical protein
MDRLPAEVEQLCAVSPYDFSDLRAVFVNCTLKRSSYLDEGSGGPQNDFTNRNTTFMTWNLLHAARMLKDAGGVPAHGNQRPAWDAGTRFDLANPEHRA